MDGYAGETIGRNAAGANATQPRPLTSLDELRDNAERASARLSACRAGIQDVIARLTGGPSNSPDQAMKDAVGCGFIGTTGSAIDRVHREITEIESALQALAQLV